MTTRTAGRVAAVTLAVLACAACGHARASTYRWGGRGDRGAYLVDMDSLKRSGSRVDFQTVFIPVATLEHPDFNKIYVRGVQWIDCARGTKFERSNQAFLGGVPMPGSSKADAQPTPIDPQSVWDSVRGLVCRGANDLPPTVLAGSDSQVVKAARAYMDAHPVVG